MRLLSTFALLTGALLIATTVPLSALLSELEALLLGLGPAAPMVFGGAYALGALVFVPGVVLNLAAGALFGVGLGIVTVSLASTTGAALAFLIARHLARDAVIAKAREHRRFGAFDQAIGASGWRFVALLRLTPAMPYNVVNYLLGVTPIPFGHFVLATWVARVPHIVIWVYLGHLSRVGVEASTTEDPRRALEWGLLGLGIVAAVVLAIYVGRITRRVLRQVEGGVVVPSALTEPRAPRRPSAGRLAVLATAGALVLLSGIAAQLWPRWFTAAFGPPAVVLEEVHPAEGARFDHGALDHLLAAHVAPGGWVDYTSLARDRPALGRYLADLGEVDFDALARDEKLALLINAYNAFTLELILEHWDGGRLRSIRDIPPPLRWDDRRWLIGGRRFSLDQLEHREIRPKFREPRIHWALVCAAASCPPLRPEAYDGARLEAQLADQARVVHGSERWLRFSREAGVVELTPLYDWYRSDFEQVDGSILAHAARWAPALGAARAAGREIDVRWLKYDWALNVRPAAPEPQ